MKKGPSNHHTCGNCYTKQSQKQSPPSTASMKSLWQLPEASSLLDVTAAVTLARLELYEPLVHRLQDGWIHLLHDVLQLVGVFRQVVHFYKRLGTQNREDTELLLSRNNSTCVPHSPSNTVMHVPRCLQTRSTVGFVHRQGS